MMLEDKILHDNIVFLRLITESTNSSVIERAINNNEYLYIYYEGDDTVQKGYRTILPLVLGYSKAGEYLLLRAWQIGATGVSDSRKRYPNDKGTYEFGWRLFQVHNMTSVLPTGRKMNNKRLPPSFDKNAYNPNDSQMSRIVLAAPPFDKDDENKISISGTDSADEPNVEKTQVNTSAFDQQTDRFRQFFKLAKTNKEIVKKDVEELYKLNKLIRKKSPNSTLVVTNEKGDFVLRDIKNKDKYPQDAIVGVLSDLHQKFVVGDNNPKMSDDFFRKQKQNINK